jgi:metallo-beta-lactamase family protein
MKIKFLGAAQTVTGSKHLITTNSGFQLLLDCGLFQGRGADNDTMNRHLGLDPEQLGAVLLSHAHIDHSGNLPNLVKQGFTGTIYCTPATYELCSIMLADSAHIQESDIAYLNKKRLQNNRKPLEPLYTLADAQQCIRQMEVLSYNVWLRINDEVEFMFSNSGHILGSAMINIRIKEGKHTRKICYTGDIGRYEDLLIKAPEPVPQADFIICESTYGNRLHGPMKEAEKLLLRVIQETCIERKGKVIIPAFSLGRTQEIVFALDKMETEGLIPHINCFVDSPLSYNATEIMRNNADELNDNVQDFLKIDDDLFCFNNLKYIRDVNESKALNSYKGPCIIISASGMMEAGRIKHHLKNHIGNPNNTLLIVGYCPPGTLGEQLIRGEKQVSIFGNKYDVKVQVAVIDGFSAHADYEEMIRFLNCQDPTLVQGLFLVHGEPEAQSFFAQKLAESGFHHISIPSKGTEVIL